MASRNLKNTGVYIDIPYESIEELHFLWWCEVLLLSGHLLKVERGEPIQITHGYKHDYEVATRKGTTVKSQTIFQPSKYTPDFILTWNPKRHRKFVWLPSYGKYVKPLLLGMEVTGGVITYVECKGNFDFNNMTRGFVLNQKFLYDKYKVLINLIKLPDLFANTFTTTKYMYTNKTGQLRKLKFEPRSLKEYLSLNQKA